MNYREVMIRVAKTCDVSQTKALEVMEAFCLELEQMPRDEKMRMALGSFGWVYQKTRPIRMADGRQTKVTPKWKLKLNPHPRFVVKDEKP